MLETLIVVILILWLLGFGLGRRGRWRRGGNLVHLLLVIVLVLLLVRFLQ